MHLHGELQAPMTTVVLRTLLWSSQFRAGSIGSRFWIEIDDQDDLSRATDQFPVDDP